MINSKKKGSAGELEWAHFCQKIGFEDVRRTAQYCGNTGDASDCVGLKYIHQEIKRVEKLNINNAYDQAKNDAKKKNLVPIVAHRKNHGKWLVTMSAEDWFKMYSNCMKQGDTYGPFNSND